MRSVRGCQTDSESESYLVVGVAVAVVQAGRLTVAQVVPECLLHSVVPELL